MKISVSLPEEDVAFVDEYAHETVCRVPVRGDSRAIELLRASRLEAEYEAAFAEGDAGEDAKFWDGSSADGSADEAR